jgi:hypothetical protein
MAVLPTSADSADFCGLAKIDYSGPRCSGDSTEGLSPTTSLVQGEGCPPLPLSVSADPDGVAAMGADDAERGTVPFFCSTLRPSWKLWITVERVFG